MKRRFGMPFVRPDGRAVESQRVREPNASIGTTVWYESDAPRRRIFARSSAPRRAAGVPVLLGHRRSRGAVGRECLSQWYPAQFELDGHVFPTAEHYMMYRKALLFRDEETAELLLRAPDPRAAKALGRRVRGFAETLSTAHRSDIVVNGNYAKFSQNPSLRTFLLGTRQSVLVEASPRDRVWGIGLAADNDHAGNPLEWRGLNLLGFALMIVRQRLELECRQHVN